MSLQFDFTGPPINRWNLFTFDLDISKGDTSSRSLTSSCRLELDHVNKHTWLVKTRMTDRIKKTQAIPAEASQTNRQPTSADRRHTADCRHIRKDLQTQTSGAQAKQNFMSQINVCCFIELSFGVVCHEAKSNIYNR